MTLLGVLFVGFTFEEDFYSNVKLEYIDVAGDVQPDGEAFASLVHFLYRFGFTVLVLKLFVFFFILSGFC